MEYWRRARWISATRGGAALFVIVPSHNVERFSLLVNSTRLARPLPTNKRIFFSWTPTRRTKHCLLLFRH